MRGQFFSIDVFIAAIILVSGSVVLLFSVTGESDLQPAQVFSGDLLRETLTKSARELTYEVLISSRAGVGYANESNPYDIEDFDKTLGEIIGEYHHLAQDPASSPTDVANYSERRDNITRKTIAPLISGQYSYEISILNETDHRHVIYDRLRVPYETAEFRVATRSIVAGIDRNREFYGPLTLEVVVWN